MVMLYEGEDFANTDRPSERTAPPVGTTAAAAAVHNGVDIPWLSPLDQLHGHLPRRSVPVAAAGEH